jgi:TRAP-type C4-dicarboxylate transport system substrate-binding protein
MQYQDAAKYITEINQPAIFLAVEISRKWYDALPKDLQQIIDRNAIAESVAVGPWAIDFVAKSRQAWLDKGGELISLPANEQTAMMESLASVGDDVSRAKPALNAAYRIVADAAHRTR